jgi:glucose/arabinose dehydrogenase
MRRLVLAALAALVLARPASAMLSTPGFRAVGVAHAAWPISALAVAPDGRLFAAIQANGQTTDPDPGTAEIRVYGNWATADGSVLDEGATWATVDGVRATTNEEGLVGIALAPDFATSKLVYVYLTTTDDGVNQQVRVYRENAGGTGDLVGTAATALEPPTESASRNGGGMTFGADGCLYVGVGDNGSSNRWNAQLLRGTDPIQSSESGALCTNVCLGTAQYPSRTIANDDAPNDAGKVLRLAVDGASPAAAGPDAPLAAQPLVFGTGLRNPVGLLAHPLTGQLWATERGDSQESEVDVVDRGSDLGWPCLEGTVVSASGVAGCLVGHVPADVYANHADWRGPVVSHPGNPTLTGIAAYTGLAYPAEYYGDVFYLLRSSARIYRVDLQPPCFLPDPAGTAPLAFHDATDDGDFTVLYDIDRDGQYDEVSFTNLTAIVQGPNPLGQQVLYVAGKQGNSNALTEHSVVFRIEYATAFTPWSGPLGRVDDACFATSGFQNPFDRPTCLPPGAPCPGQPDGTSCDDGDPCNGRETCAGGVCQHGAPPPDGTACGAATDCRAVSVCQAGACVAGAAAPDGTGCAGDDPCAGRAACSAGTCRVTGAADALDVARLRLGRELRGPGSGTLALRGGFRPSTPVAPESTDALALELRDGGGAVFSATIDHPADDPFWKVRKGLLQLVHPGAPLSPVTLRTQRSGAVRVDARARHAHFEGLDDATLETRLRIGDQCFIADLAGRCMSDAKKLRCR